MEASHSHVLTITQDSNVAAQMREDLERLGLLQLTASTDAEALAHLKRGEVDLIVCERAMPGLDSVAFRQLLLTHPEWRMLPFIFLVPEGLVAGERDDAGEHGIEACVFKPIDRILLAARMAALLERAALYSHVIREDPLTCLLNKASIVEEIERELRRAKRYQSLCSLIFLDLDNFKGVNDNFGHNVGDRVLRHTARLIQSNIRAVDLAGRFGGEEFLIALPETDAAGALLLGNRLLEMIKQPAAGLPRGLKLSFSAGIVQAPRDGGRFDLLVERSDRTMYLAKSRGKSQVLCWSEHFADDGESTSVIVADARTPQEAE